MKLGVIVPQGWTGEYDGWETERAWARTVAVAQQADRLGFESIWLFDHLHTIAAADRRDHLRVVHVARRPSRP